MHAFLQSGQDAVDGLGNAINAGRRCIGFIQSIVGSGITIMSTTLGTVNQVRARPPALTTHMSHTVLRAARQSRTGLLLVVLPTAI